MCQRVKTCCVHSRLASSIIMLGAAARHGRTLATAASSRPFRVLGLQQVALGGLSKSKLSHLWSDILGVPKVGVYVSEKENVDEDIHKLGCGPFAVEVDLMQPIDANKSPKVHVPALNHIGLWVDDIRQAVSHLSAQGMRFTPGGIRKGAAGHDVAFIHPKGNEAFPLCGEGVLLELVQAVSVTNVIELIVLYSNHTQLLINLYRFCASFSCNKLLQHSLRM